LQHALAFVIPQMKFKELPKENLHEFVWPSFCMLCAAFLKGVQEISVLTQLSV
jgi:hypothetical protein